MCFKSISPLALFGFHAAATSTAPTAQYHALDFNALLDGTLGDMPAMWLVTHGTLASLNTTKTSLANRSGSSLAPATTSTAPTNRHKDNGAVVGAFIGAALLTPVKINDEGKLKGICQALVAGATAMGSTVVGQEAGKAIYGTNSTAPDFEEGLVPGAFIGGAIGGGVSTALSKSLCDIGAPGMKEFLGDLGTEALERVEMLLASGLPQILPAHLEELGVDPARAAKFAVQLQEALRFMHLKGSASAVEFMTRELTSETLQLANSLADGSTLLNSPAVGALAQFGAMNGAALGLPPVVPSVVSAAPAIGNLLAVTGQLSNALGFASFLPPTAESAMQVKTATDALHHGLSQAATDVASNASKFGLSNVARNTIKKTGKLAFGILNTLDRLRPAHSNCHGKEQTSVVTATREHTTAVPLLHTSTVTIHSTEWLTDVQTVSERVTKTRTIKFVEAGTATVTVTATATPKIDVGVGIPTAPDGVLWCLPPGTTPRPGSLWHAPDDIRPLANTCWVQHIAVPYRTKECL